MTLASTCFHVSFQTFCKTALQFVYFISFWWFALLYIYRCILYVLFICHILKCTSFQPSNFSIFLSWQIKCWGNHMKMHFASALPQQCFSRGWQDFISRASAFTSATSAKTSMRSKLVRMISLLHISPRIRSIMCTIIVVQILLYKYCYMQCNVLFYHVKNCVLKIHFDALFEFKVKRNMKERCSID